MKRILHFYLLSALLLLLSGCSFREITPNSAPNQNEDDMILMAVDIDWSELGETPTGMTILFYPSNGSVPIMRLTNQVHHYECLLPNDEYSIIAYNQSEDEYASLKFQGFDALETAQVHVKEDTIPSNRIDRLYKLQKANTRAKSQAATMIRNVAAAVKRASESRAKTVNTTMKARVLTSMMEISVEIENLRRGAEMRANEPTVEVVAVNGALTGLAYGYQIGKDKLIEESLTHELDEWEIHFAETPDGIGHVETKLMVFGISPLIRSNRTGLTEEDTENILYLNFRLSDGTYVPYRFLVTDRIIEHTISGEYVAEIKLELHIGVKIQGVEDGLENPIVLPETGLSYGGIQLDVQSWGDPIEQNITVK